MRYKINYLKIFFFIIFFSFNYIKNLNAEISNNIVVMVGDEMITSYDLKQEKLYLSLINQININSLNKKQLDDMAKDSLIREKVKLNVLCPDDNKTRTDITINLEDIDVHMEATHNNEISVTDNITIFMRYPTLKDMTNVGTDSNDVATVFNLIKRSVVFFL